MLEEKIDLFKIHGAEELFKEIVSAHIDFCAKPNNRALLFLLFSLNHLREWIAGTNWNGIKQIPRKDRKQRHKFFIRIGNTREFKVVNNLCNRSKHYVTQSVEHKTAVVEGARAGLARAGDSLGQVYYLVGDEDIRGVFSTVIAEYQSWFSKKKL